MLNKWERILQREGLGIILDSKREIHREYMLTRKFAERSQDEIDAVRAYYTAAMAYLDTGHFLRGERSIWAYHAETGHGIHVIARDLGLGRWRVRAVLDKHRKLAGLTSPWTKERKRGPHNDCRAGEERGSNSVRRSGLVFILQTRRTRGEARGRPDGIGQVNNGPFSASGGRTREASTERVVQC